MKKTEFVKTVASGNDFIIIDRFGRQKTARPGKAKRAGEDRRQLSKLSKELCQRRLSVGADGLLLIEPSKKADLKMRIFNPDGTEVDMCGNGLRCAALYAAKERICSDKMVIETGAGDLRAEVKENKVRIKMSRPEDLRLKFDLDINGQTQQVNYINTGVPHIICFVQELDSFNVEEIGRAIRYHPQFQPGGTNADFVEVLDKGRIKIRTFERGVEQETLACGTGAVAAAIITRYQMQEEPQGTYKIEVAPRSRELLTVYFGIEKGVIDKVFLEGRAGIVYKGVICEGRRRNV